MKNKLLIGLIFCVLLCLLASCTEHPEVSEPAVSLDVSGEISRGEEVSLPVSESLDESKPEVSEPEVSEPEVSEPEASEPEVSEPEVSEPEASEPEVSEPEVSEPEVSEPEVSEPEVSEPEVSEPEVSEPEISEPEVSEPEISEPEISEPETVFAENVEISSSKEELYPGETATLTVTVTPEEATDKSVIWEIDSGSEYATLSADGVLTAKAAGTVVVKVTTKDGSDISAFYTITVKAVPASSITISGDKEVTAGGRITLTATVKPEDADKGVVWSVESGSQYASISADGVLTAVAPGEVVVKATAKDGSGVSATYTITVKPVLVTSVTISGNTTVEEGKTVTLSAAVKPSNASNKEVTWSIESGSQYASISASGVLTAKAAGTVTVKATAKDGSGVSATYTITVKPILVSSITISGDKEVTVDDKITLSATVKPSNASNKEVTWSIESGSRYASISADGVLTAKKAGTVTVKVTAKDGSGVSATYTITVKPILVSSITISGDKEVKVGNTITLSATVKPDNAANKGVTWSISSGSSYASISSDGVLTAKKAGTVTVKATAKDGSGVSATYTVTVKPVLVSSVTISGDKEVKEGDKITLTATVKPDNAGNKAVTWSIQSGSSYASISSDGVLTAKKAGTVTVKATAKDGSGVSATYTVTVKSAALWSGSGTQKDPYLITCLEDLMNLQKVVDKQGYYFKQVADIDCSSVATWIVIGDWDNPFRHHYDGGGYTISNICYDGEAQSLFSHVEGSHFKNMNIVNAHTKDNHRTEENRTDKQPGGGESTAAIVGYGSGCSFENCTAVVNFLSSNSTTGGLIGGVTLENKEYVLMKNCHVSGTITGGGNVGGLIGTIGKYMADGDYSPAETITIENCSADVEIIIFTSSTETPCVGGLIGESFGVKIEKCHATGSINVIDGDIGGLVGNAGNYTDILRCYASVDIYASSDDHYGGVSIGGLIGHIYSRSDVIDCYATGNITAPYVEWSPCQDSTNRNGGPWRRYYNPCGSLIGCLEVFEAYSEDQKITVYNCYATGIVNVPNICEDKRVYCHGALIGLVLDRNTVLSYNIKDPSKKELTSWDDFKEYHIGHFGDNYNLEDLRTYYEPINDYEYRNIYGLQNPKYKVLPTHDYVEIITEAQLLDQSIFEGWDFENVWVMTEDGPKLR